MSSIPPRKDWPPLPGKLNDLPRMGFTRRAATSNAEFERDDVVFGATSISDAIRRGRLMREKQKNTDEAGAEPPPPKA